jgi:RNA polymerase sigma-70 factor, ECF subfamily
MPELQIIGGPQSNYVRVVRIACAEKGVPYTLVPVMPYQLQAAIAAVHAEAGTAAETDWAQIAALYDKLAQINPTPVVLLNGAVAVGMSDGPRRGLALIDSLGASGALDRYHLFHAARADMLRRLGSPSAAADAYRQALALTANGIERTFLERRLAAL